MVNMLRRTSALALAMTCCACANVRPRDTYREPDAALPAEPGNLIPPMPGADGDDDGPSRLDGSDTDSGTQPRPPGEDQPSSRAAAAGEYAMRVVLAGTISALGRNVATQVVTYGLLRVREQDDALTFSERPCFVEVRSGNAGVRPSMTPNVVQSLAATQAVASFDAGGDTFRRDAWRLPLGWRPRADTDVIPSAASDARVVDADRDGSPGVTLHADIDGLFGSTSSCDVASVFDARLAYALAVSGDALVGVSATDLGSAYEVLALEGAGCPADYTTTLTGPHAVAVARLPGDTTFDCAAHTLDTLSAAFE